jgi:hypothetical protein
MKSTALSFTLAALTMTLAACSSQPKDVTVGLGTGASALGGVNEPTRTDGTCDVRLVACSGICVQIDADKSNCGSCGTVCATAQSCTSGACVTPPPPPPVDSGVPADDAGVSSDAAACEFGKASCGGGPCIDILFDNGNCGACGVVCASGTTCTRGYCM